MNLRLVDNLLNAMHPLFNQESANTILDCSQRLTLLAILMTGNGSA